MHTFEESRDVAGVTPAEAFDYVADPDRGTEWAGAADEIRAEGEPGEGRRIIATAGMLGLSFEVEQTVTVYERPDRYAWEGTKPFHTSFDFRFSEAGDGTRIDARLEVDPGRFFPIGGRLIARQFRKQFRGDLDRLADRLAAG